MSSDLNNNKINRSDIDRLEFAFVNALEKLEKATTNGNLKLLS